MNRSLAILALAPLLLAPRVFAQRVELTSPLAGHVRFGDAASLRVAAKDLAGGTLTLRAPGVIPVQLPVVAGRVDAIIPLHWRGEPPTSLEWSDGQAGGSAALPAKALGVDDRLVATAGDIADATTVASTLFPDRRPVVVKLDVADPRLAFPPAAFEAVDALLLDLPSAARIDESQLGTLLAGGTVVAIRSAAKPAGNWPWKQQGDWWVLRHEVGGPRGDVLPDIYAPASAWDRSWPAETRHQVLLATIAGGLLVLAATLLRGRRGTVAGLVVCGVATGGALVFGGNLSTASTAAGEVVVWDGATAQRDRWTYVSGLRDGTIAIPASDGITKPVLGTRRPVEGLSLTLVCGPDGSPARYDVALPRRITLAFLSRAVDTAEPTGSFTKSGFAPIGLFADKLYPGVMAGHDLSPPAGAPRTWWGTVRMNRAAE